MMNLYKDIELHTTVDRKDHVHYLDGKCNKQMNE